MGLGFLLRLLLIFGLATIVAGVGVSVYHWSGGSSHAVQIAVALFLGTCLLAFEEGWPPKPITESSTQLERTMSKTVMWVIWYPSYLVGTLAVLTFVALLLFKIIRWVLS